MPTRRNFLTQSGLFFGAGLAGVSALAQNKKSADAPHHGGHSHGGAVSVLTPTLKEIQKTSDNCLDVGRTCVAHCNLLLREGDSEMAACQMTVMNMLAVTEAVSTVSHYNSFEKSGFVKLLKACIEMCKSCEAECKKHADKHSECKACMDACQKCIKACDAYLK